ncbi:zinc dependent phospholipase C family protein [Virgibacillus soli]|uniref:zinc dependent phospholipase C family protein n=1 Tax=Paracerasibacillus soli TaxID=480284 RepID=UPI0035E80703
MPSVWTHMLFCENIIDLLDRKAIPNVKNETYLKLGSLGPDLFLYYHFWRPAKHKTYMEKMDFLRKKNYLPYLIDLVEQMKGKESHLLAYTFGFITHLALEHRTYSFISYFANERKIPERKLETIIDTILMKKYHNLNTWKSKIDKEIDVGFNLDKQLCESFYPLLANSLLSTHDHVLPADFMQRAYRDTKLALKLLADPHGWKNTFLSRWTAAYSHRPVITNQDYLNLKQRTWHNVNTNDTADLSFIQLFEQSKIEAASLMQSINHYWSNKNNMTIDDIKSIMHTYFKQ